MISLPPWGCCCSPPSGSAVSSRQTVGTGGCGLRIAVGVGRGVTALQPHLMRPLVTEIEEEVRVEGHPAFGVGIELDHPALDAVGIELGVPGHVEGVGEVDAPAIPADLDHLRPPVERLARRRMRGPLDDAADAD